MLQLAGTPEARAAMIADLTKRICGFAGELKMWRLTAEERNAVLAKLEAALSGHPPAKRQRRRKP